MSLSQNYFKEEYSTRKQEYVEAFFVIVNDYHGV